jgi:signal peptidase I
MFLAMTLLTMSQLSVVKTYIVPTGSMAPTVLGFHKDVTCPKCKRRFAINASSEMDPGGGQPEKITGCTCANCRYPIDFAKDKVTPLSAGGDRILVLAATAKSLRRGDVTVHRYPPAWFEERESRIYVSRLMGLPGETLALHEGRLYVSTDVKYKADKVKPEELWRPQHMHIDDKEALKRFQQGKVQIVRKSPAMLLTQRRLVYDHDFPAGDMPPRWVGAKDSAWKKDDSHGFQHEGQGAGVDWLSYRHLVRSDKPGQTKPSLIVDDLAYNHFKTAKRDFDLPPNWVGDLMLQTQLTITKAEGELWLDLARSNDRFQACFDLATGRCTLYRLAKNAKAKELASVKETALNKAGTYVLRFANCDDRLTLWIDDQLPFGDGVSYDPSAQKGPTLDDLEPVRIGSRGDSLQVRHLQVWRNIYFAQQASFADAEGFEPSDPKTWAPLRKLPVRTFYVQPGHYFFISDNPSAASDSRLWGVVPEQLLAGRVVTRYFPFERASWIR